MVFDINYLAVLVAAIANMAVGSLWYGPVFGKMWMKYMGFTHESIKSMPLKPWQAMIGGFVTALLLSYVLAHVAIAFGAKGVMGALQLAFYIWLGFTATTLAESFLWEGKPLGLFMLNASRSIVTLAVMSLILVLWI